MPRRSPASSSSSSTGGTTPSPLSSPLERHRVHGPWNRKSITAILSQQQDDHHACYGSRHDGGAVSTVSTTATGSGGGGEEEDPGGGASRDAAAAAAAAAASATIATGHHHRITPAYYGLWDLVSVGVGGTVGSGIFVLTGYIANHYAGPATWASFAVSGCAALCSGVSFAEFSGRLPRVEGSTYTYAYVSMGEYAAVLAASCLTLEYGVSGAAVARSWGDKVLEWMARGTDRAVDHAGQREAFFNPLAGVISLACVVVLACGVWESKAVTNFFTVTKMGLVAFMVVGGVCLFRTANLTPLLVPTAVSDDGTTSFGPAGILRGATSSFFGYLGFDEVVCLAAEAKNPSDIPRAVLWTLAIVTVVYIAASVALCGMLPFRDISDTSGFPNAFADRGIGWAANLSAFGEVFTLPVVVLISLLAQPRLCAAMARDGLLPSVFALQTGRDGNLLWSNVLCGIPMTLLATFVPFSWMDDAISVGILFAFNMTNTALIIMRCGGGSSSEVLREHYRDSVRDGILPSDDDIIAVDEANGIVSSSYPKGGGHNRGRRWQLAVHLGCYHLVALLAGLTSHLTVTTELPLGDTDGDGQTLRTVATPWWTAQAVAAGIVLAHAAALQLRFPATGGFGDALARQRSHDSDADLAEHDAGTAEAAIFKVPLCPFLPLVGVYLNWYLISQLEWSGMLLLLVFLIAISVLYGCCISGSRIPPPHPQPPGVHRPQPYSDDADDAASTVDELEGPILLREMSLPKRNIT